MDDNVQLQLQETKKLLERARVAREEFVHGQNKLQASCDQLESLLTRLYGTDQTAWRLMDDLTLVRGSGPVLRSKVEMNKMAVQKQMQLVKKEIKESYSHL